MVLHRHGQRNPDGTFNWRDALIDATIMAGLTFFTALGGMGATGLVGVRELASAGIAAATQFFLILAIKRGLKEKSPSP